MRKKKRNYNNRELQIIHRRFTPSVFSIYGSMDRECAKFYFKFADLLCDKQKQSKSLTINRLRTKVCCGLLKSCLSCLRGSRSINRNIIKMDKKMMVSNELALMN